jgi:hypothetical protein
MIEAGYNQQDFARNLLPEDFIESMPNIQIDDNEIGEITSENQVKLDSGVVYPHLNLS